MGQLTQQYMIWGNGRSNIYVMGQWTQQYIIWAKGTKGSIYTF
jgi:hypothetical protein